MRSFFRPTLAKRMVLTALLGFPLTWLVLVAIDLSLLRHQWEQDDRDFGSTPIGSNLRAAFSTVAKPEQVAMIAAAIRRIRAEEVRREPASASILLQILDRGDRHVVFSSDGIAGETLHGDTHHKTSNTINGRPYDVYEVDTPHWAVLWARQRITIRTYALILRLLSADIIRNMTYALPCFVLPAWLAVAYGLRPLRRFSRDIAGRGPDDLSPTGTVAKHAELQPLRMALDDLLARLRRKREGEEAFVANAAHELRTPLAVIEAQAHLLANAGSRPERLESQRQMEAAIDRASHLIHQLLSLTRMEMEQQQLSLVDVAQLVRQELAQFVPIANRREIEIALDAPDTLMATLETHPLRSILQNLVDNAIRYGHAGGQVWVEIREEEKMLTLSVADNGPGIEPAMRESIFDRFQRGSNPCTPGTGLGLAIVKQAATRMGGAVRLTEGPDGRGCRFTVDMRPGNSSA